MTPCLPTSGPWSRLICHRLAPTPLAAVFEVLRMLSSQGLTAWLVEAPELPVIDHLTAWNAKVDAVTGETVRALARRLMQPETLRFAVAGDPPDIS